MRNGIAAGAKKATTGRNTETLSTLPSQARISPNWKEEVNQRLAAHKNRKPVPVTDQSAAAPEQSTSNNRATAAAARVAARFAKAPRYSELLENEARAAVRAAEAASRAALQAQAVAETVLAELQAANAAQPEWQFHANDDQVEAHFIGQAVEQLRAASVVQSPIETEPESQSGQDQTFEIRWEPDTPKRHQETGTTNSRLEAEAWRETVRDAEEESVEMVEPFQPIHANLIEFPREIVATRKARPRRAEGPFAAQHQHDVQLSIFEVEPETISIDPVTVETMSAEAAPTWMNSEWSGMQLDELPANMQYYEAQSDLLEEPMRDFVKLREIDQAPLNLRAMAAVVDSSLVLAAFSAITFEFVRHSHNLPEMRTAQLGAAAGLFLMSALYVGLFNAMGRGTPGMRYARIALSTFDGEIPTRKMRFQRFAATVLSVLPVGVGVLWSIFDEDRLTWHDRLSRTYLRAY